MWINGMVPALWSAAAWAQTNFGPKYEREDDSFDPAGRYDPNVPVASVDRGSGQHR